MVLNSSLTCSTRAESREAIPASRNDQMSVPSNSIHSRILNDAHGSPAAWSYLNAPGNVLASCTTPFALRLSIRTYSGLLPEPTRIHSPTKSLWLSGGSDAL